MRAKPPTVWLGKVALASAVTVAVSTVGRAGVGVLTLRAPRLDLPGPRPALTAAMSRHRFAMRRKTLIVLVGLALLTAIGAPTAAAKDLMWLRICGANGCKLIKAQGIDGGLLTEAEQYGEKVRASVRVPMYEVTVVLPSSLRAILHTEGLRAPREPTYWLRQRRIQFLIAES